jgi:2-polyprenyl-3-methyl-5-hydroxy-6-metoxy-1,4-benzoquinol methylase
MCGDAMVPWMAVPCDWRRPDHPAAYFLYWCDACQFGQIDPRPNRDEITNFYEIDSYFTHDDGSVRRHSKSFTLLDRLRIKVAYMNDQGAEMNSSWLRKHFAARSRICDIGCGNGNLLTELSRLGHEVTGVEPDPQAADIAERKGHRVFRGTAEDLPEEISNERFDYIVMLHVLEHCLDPKLAISSAAGLLVEGGLLFIETPNNEARGLQQAGVIWPWLEIPRHLNFFTIRSLRSISEAAGLSVKDVEYRGYTRQFMPDWIGMERRIHDVFSSNVGLRSELPGPNRESASWKLLLSTARLPERLKYDSIRVTVGRAGDRSPATRLPERPAET